MNKYSNFTLFLSVFYCLNAALAGKHEAFSIFCLDDTGKQTSVRLEEPGIEILKEHFEYFEGLFSESYLEAKTIEWRFPCATLNTVIYFLNSEPDENGLLRDVGEIDLTHVLNYLSMISYYAAKDSFALPVIRQIIANFSQFDEDTQGQIKSTIDREFLTKKWDAAKQWEFAVNGATFTFVEIPAGTYIAGETDEELDEEVLILFEDFFGPSKEVEVEPFMMMKHEVTQGQWKAIMGDNPSHFKGNNRPVESVSYTKVQKFINKLNEHLAEQNLSLARLPTKEEWEYAAKAGTTTRYFWGDDESKAGDYGWHNDNSEGETHQVATKGENPFRLYDMSGNVWEWVDVLENVFQTNTILGGSWADGVFGNNPSQSFRKIRSGSKHLGFRLVRPSAFRLPDENS